MNWYIRTLSTLFAREEGQTLAEYAIVLALIAVATITAVTAVGTGIGGQLTSITATL